MNKPNRLEMLTEVSNSYCDNLLKIFDNNYQEENNKLYNRDEHFRDVECGFTVNRFKIENKNNFKQFINISEELLGLLKDRYGPGEMWNLQIAKMKGNGEIIPHIDLGLGFLFSHRIHIPLVTNKNVIFTVEDEKFYLKKNYVYELNNLKIHSVQNKNNHTHNRIHLIFDYMPSEYILFIKSEKEKLNFRYQ